MITIAHIAPDFISIDIPGSRSIAACRRTGSGLRVGGVRFGEAGGVAKVELKVRPSRK